MAAGWGQGGEDLSVLARPSPKPLMGSKLVLYFAFTARRFVFFKALWINVSRGRGASRWGHSPAEETQHGRVRALLRRCSDTPIVYSQPPKFWQRRCPEARDVPFAFPMKFHSGLAEL